MLTFLISFLLFVPLLQHILFCLSSPFLRFFSVGDLTSSPHLVLLLQHLFSCLSRGFFIFFEGFLRLYHLSRTCDPLPLTLCIIAQADVDCNRQIAQNNGKNFVQSANCFSLDKLCEVWYNGKLRRAMTERGPRNFNIKIRAFPPLYITMFLCPLLKILKTHFNYCHRNGIMITI